MSGIVCAIRGGPMSQSTIDRSIQLAKETGQIITFIYVVNLDFLTHSSSSRTEHISSEMQEMGEFILLDAQDQAQKQGVKAEGIIRDGSVIDQIIAYCEEAQPDYIVLGQPETSRENNLLSGDRMHEVIQRIKEAVDIEVIVSSS